MLKIENGQTADRIICFSCKDGDGTCEPGEVQVSKEDKSTRENRASLELYQIKITRCANVLQQSICVRIFMVGK